MIGQVLTQKLKKRSFPVSFSVISFFIIVLSHNPVSAAEPCSAVFYDFGGGKQDTVPCGSAANTTSNIDVGSGVGTSSFTFVAPCSSPDPGQAVQWFSFNIIRGGMAFEWQVIETGSDDILYELYYSNDVGGPNECTDLTYYRCGDYFSSWERLSVPEPTLPTRFYLAIYSKDPNDSKVTVNLKFRKACGEDAPCAIAQDGEPTVVCDPTGYHVSVPVLALNSTYNVSTNGATSVSPSSFVASAPATAETITLFYPENIDPWSVTVSGDSACDVTVSDVAPDCNLSCESFVRAYPTGFENDLYNTWGGAWVDYNGDGYDDLMVADYDFWRSSKMYENNGDGTFTSVTIGDPVVDQGSNAGVVFGDYDNDGDPDLYTANNVRISNFLYANSGGSFTKVNDSPISGYDGYSHSASWVDYDNDGYLDLFATDFMSTRYNQLYHANGDGTFSVATGNPINIEAYPTFSGVWADYDNDGLQDLFVANLKNEDNSLFHNDGNGSFTKITSGSIVSDGGNSHTGSWGDYDNDGDMDLFVGNASNQKDFLYQNDGDGTFTKKTSLAMTSENGHTFGSVWADFNNDGHLDLYVVHDNSSTNSLFFNNGDGTFTQNTSLVPATDTENSVSTMVSDYDNDGDVDIFVANKTNKENALYINQASLCGNHYACFNLTGTASNADAIGARIQVKATINGSEVWQTRQISTQSGGISAQSSLTQHFGLGDATTIDSVVIYWPSGYVQYLTSGITVDGCNDITEPQDAQVTFLAFIDGNGNCTYDAGEVVLPGISGTITELNGVRISTDAQGQYTMNMPAGTYTFVEDASADYTHPCYTDLTFSALSGQSTTTYLPHNAAYIDADLWVELSSTAQRIGERNTYTISYGNDGNTTAYDVEIAVTFDGDITPVYADSSWDFTEGSIAEGGGTYIWTIDSVEAFTSYSITIIDSVSSDAVAGTQSTTTVTYRSVDSDNNYSDNSDISTPLLVASFDPNDILVKPEGDIIPGDSLVYRIRFENMGNHPVEHVYIVDTLSQFLDLSTFRMLSTSHYCRTRINPNGVIEFFFQYIMLPGEGTEPGENEGYAEFSIFPHDGLSDYTVIENQAGIKFDHQAMIMTNTVHTTYRLTSLADSEQTAEDSDLSWPEGTTPLEGVLDNDISVRFFPNPASKNAFLSIQSDKSHNYQLRVVNAQGQEIFSRELQSQQASTSIEIPVSTWSPGFYTAVLCYDSRKVIIRFIRQ